MLLLLLPHTLSHPGLKVLCALLRVQKSLNSGFDVILDSKPINCESVIFFAYPKN